MIGSDLISPVIYLIGSDSIRIRIRFDQISGDIITDPIWYNLISDRIHRRRGEANCHPCCCPRRLQVFLPHEEEALRRRCRGGCAKEEAPRRAAPILLLLSSSGSPLSIAAFALVLLLTTQSAWTMLFECVPSPSQDRV